ncbi:MAG: glycosyltransferase family 4 protein [Spirochaetales bacterium]|nr:glycosyltransferase family 4 protein [Spirochaetales bacterium]
MRILLVHFHLGAGGVGSVLRAQAELARKAGFAVGIAAGSFDGPVGDFERFEIPELAYEMPGGGPPDEKVLDARGRALGEKLVAAARSLGGRGRASDEGLLVHAHNLALRKTRVYPGALAFVARELPVLVHCHDFGEEWRPDSVHDSAGYPEGCAWAALNGRDRAALVAAGLPPESVALIPNAVRIPDHRELPAGASARDRDLVLYPVRGIPRKNLGEALLASLFLPAGVELAVTLPPSNPLDLPDYEHWVAFSARLGLRARFGAGLSAQLDELYARSRCALSTSVKEGFGFSFLEPIARGLPVAGRRLESVIPDFEESGLRFPSLYTGIATPEGLYDRAAFERRLEVLLDRVSAAYRDALGSRGRPGLAAVDEAIERTRAMYGNSMIDFAALDAEAQSELIALAASDPGARADVLEAAPFLSALADAIPPTEADRAALGAAYSPEKAGAVLLAAWRGAAAAAHAASGRSPDPVSLFRSLSRPDNFSPRGFRPFAGAGNARSPA